MTIYSSDVVETKEYIENISPENDLQAIKDFIETLGDKVTLNFEGSMPKERLFSLLKSIYNAGMKNYNKKVDISGRAWKVQESFLISFHINDNLEKDEFYYGGWHVKDEFIAEKIAKEAESIFLKGMLLKGEEEKAKIDYATYSVRDQMENVMAKK